MEKLHELALFAGAGGGILGGHLLGWRTVCAVEWEPYPASVLCARQNDKILPPFPIWDDVQTFDGKPWRGIVDVVSGGFPCQDISVAGNGAGLDGERSGMWREMARIIGEVRPRYAFVENSPMLVNRGLERVLADLTSMGYDSRWGVISAADVGANHKRERIWILAYAKHGGYTNEVAGKHGKEVGLPCEDRPQRSGSRVSIETGGVESGRSANWVHDAGQISNTTSIGLETTRSELKTTRVSGSSKDVGNTQSARFSSCVEGQGQGQPWRASIGSAQWWQIEPPLDRVVDGMADRVDRLKAIGNGQVPLCAATAWRLLK